MLYLGYVEARIANSTVKICKIFSGHTSIHADILIDFRWLGHRQPLHSPLYEPLNPEPGWPVKDRDRADYENKSVNIRARDKLGAFK